MQQALDLIRSNLLWFLFLPPAALFLIFLLLDWIRDRYWKRNNDPTLALPDHEPSPVLKMHSRLANDQGRRQSANWNPARYRTQHVAQPRPLELEE